MKKGEILSFIINQFFIFDEVRDKRNDYSIEEFISYLDAQKGKEKLEFREFSGKNKTFIKKEYRDAVTDISILLVFMYRYAKGYLKKALRGSSLHTADEFSFLITIMTSESLRKSELIAKQIMEKTTGMEVINRLINSGLIVESADKKDKRSKIVSITKAGMDEIRSVIPLMGKVSEIIVGNLSNEEINTLAYLLKKLDYYHNDIYTKKKNLPLTDIWSETVF